MKDIFCSLRGMTDMDLLYSYASRNGSNPFDLQYDARLVGYANICYLSDQHKARSQTSYVFTIGNTSMSWRYMKQTIAYTSPSYAEILTLHKIVHEYIWLRADTKHV
jgi:hypothetical protein